ncbi:hypothetical protein BSQ44_08630 [Aquibium oceanicum]|uniref:Uncharacterized protein n=1 Tax=Aquibium oceanicum TaxID=1670800 RepID=A0A1L3SPU4_9HYPH|nr:hypothetical protein BSQ44_08630 [Aquibium oceanicum]
MGGGMNAPVIRRLATTVAGAVFGAGLLLWAFPVRGEMLAILHPREGGEVARAQPVTEGGTLSRDLAKFPPSVACDDTSPPLRGVEDSRGAIARPFAAPGASR